MNERQDIYFKRHLQYDRNLEKLEKAEMDADSKLLIRKWHNSLFSKGSRKLRIAKLTYQIIAIYDLGDKYPLKNMNKDRVVSILAKIAKKGEEDKANNKKGWSDTTQQDYKRCLKQFYSWYEEEDPRLENNDKEAFTLYRYLKKHVSLATAKKQINPSDIITEGDLSILIEKGCHNSRDRAFISLLHESGCRIGEMLNLRIKDISQDFSKIHVDGKTGKRSVPIKIISPAYLQKWLQDHPDKENPNALVWVCIEQSRKGQPLNYIGAIKLVKRAFTKSKINKKSNVHWFRHSRATINAEFMTEPMLCIYFGWTIGSRQVSTYTHASSKQVESVLNRHYGIESEANTNQPIRCHKCMTMNITGSKFCSLCGAPLTTEAFETKESYENMAFDLLQKIMGDDNLRNKFLTYQKKQEIKK